jgi:hypothetical protein
MNTKKEANTNVSFKTFQHFVDFYFQEFKRIYVKVKFILGAIEIHGINNLFEISLRQTESYALRNPLRLSLLA